MSTKPSKSIQKKITFKMGNVVKSDPTKLNDEFSRYFTSIAQKIRQDIPHSRKSFRDYMVNPKFFLFLTNQPWEIVDIIKKLDPHKSTCPFSIHNKIPLLRINEISSVLSDIFNLSFTTDRCMTKLKTAKVIPT